MSEQDFSLLQTQHFSTHTPGGASESRPGFGVDKAVLDFNSLYGADNAGFDPMEYVSSFDSLSQYSFDDAAFSAESTLPTDSTQASSVVNPADLWKADQRLGSFDTEDWCYTSPPQHVSPNAAGNEHKGKSRKDSAQPTPRVDFGAVDWSTQAPAQTVQRQQSRGDDDASLERVQRARNAANKRHSMAKTSRSDSGGSQSPEGEQGEEAGDPKLGRYREKNRIAAGRCRAKKKSHVEDLQTRYARESARHTHLKNQVLELRNTLTFLRDCSLQHHPSGCDCESLRRYNLARAEKVAGGS